MAYEVVMSYHLHMPSYFLGTFTEYPSPNVIYYLIDENRIVIAAMLHSKQSPETVRKTISEFLKQYK